MSTNTSSKEKTYQNPLEIGSPAQLVELIISLCACSPNDNDISSIRELLNHILPALCSLRDCHDESFNGLDVLSCFNDKGVMKLANDKRTSKLHRKELLSYLSRGNMQYPRGEKCLLVSDKALELANEACLLLEASHSNVFSRPAPDFNFKLIDIHR